MNRLFGILCTILCCGIFAISIVSIKTIGELKESNLALKEEIKVDLQNQTALFYKTIGEVIPVVVPEEYKSKFIEIQNAYLKAKETLDTKDCEYARNQYTEFIKSTPPWIQDELNSEIVNIHYGLGYYSMLAKYNFDENIDNLLNSLENYIAVSGDWEDIEIAINFYNENVAEENKKYDEKILEISKNIENCLHKKSSTAEVIAIYNEALAYQNDEKISVDLKNLQKYYQEANSFDEINENVAKLLSYVKENTQEYTQETYSLVMEYYSSYLLNAKSLSLFDNAEILSKLDECKKSIDNYYEKLVTNEEQEIYRQSVEAISDCEEVLNLFKDNYYAEGVFETLLEQLYQCLYSIKGLEKVNISEGETRVLAAIKNVNEYINKSSAIDEAKVLNDLERSVLSCSELLNDNVGSSRFAMVYSVLSEQLDQNMLIAKSISSDQKNKIIKDIENLNTKLDETLKECQKSEEQEALDDLDKSVSYYKTQINSLTNNSTSAAMISIISAQLASAQVSLSSIKNISTAAIETKINECKTLLNNKEKSLEKTKIQNDENALKNYNSDALRKIQSIKTSSESIKEKDKDLARKNLLLELEKINTGYLYMPVGTLYQDVYNAIWNKLKSDDKFDVTNRAITIQKKDIYERF